MKRLLLFIYNLFKELCQSNHRPKPTPKPTPEPTPEPRPGTREYYLYQGLSKSIYRMPAEKYEPEEIFPKILPVLFPLVPEMTLLPPIINRTDDHSSVKNLNTKPVIHVKQVSREDAFRLSNLSSYDVKDKPTIVKPTLFITEE